MAFLYIRVISVEFLELPLHELDGGKLALRVPKLAWEITQARF